MIDDEKARVTGTRKENEQDWLTVETVAGNSFEIVRPVVSEAVEGQLFARAAAIVEEESDAHGS